MTIIDCTTVLGVILTLLIQVVTGEYCDNGEYCSFDEYCCGSMCCRNSYGYSFWNLWYFWFVMFIIMMSCCGMCSYAKRRQYYGQQHNQIIIPGGPGRTTNITATAYPVGVRPPPGPAVHHQHALPPQAYQSPPPYSEVTSKPDLYPAYQGPPTAMPYPTQQYAFSPEFQQQPMYPPGPPPPTNAGQPPAYTHMQTPTAPSDS
ncbi:uncharacterized protein [Apostichopus japonicus]|uniref:uncharacterized protein n=1 Tax=Stichopus japonicus TaxID=307972 RepID=UPI003AB8C689